MKKAAFFVEGLTEQLFVCRLLTEIAGKRELKTVACEARGSGTHRFREFSAISHADENYFALIVDCGSDKSVVSDIRDTYDRLVAAGYTAIVGIRDVYPDFARTDISKAERGQYYGLKTKPFRPLMILAIMEVECWFLGEASHFLRIDPNLTHSRIMAERNYDPASYDPQLHDHPAEELHAIYSIVGKAYRKERKKLARTIDALDFGEIYLRLPGVNPALRALTESIDAFLA